MGLGGVISNLLSLGAKLLFVVSESVQAPSSSSSSAPVEGHEIEADLQRLMKMLEGIQAKLYDAEERVIRDRSVKLWLKELKRVAYDAEDILDEYHYEVLRAQVEARDASPPNPRKRKQVQVPDNMFNKIKEIMGRFDEIERHRIELRLFHEDAPRRVDTELQIDTTSHFIVESNIFGREKEKEDLIDLLSSESHDGSTVSVVTIVGMGGLGKTTLAQLVYNDQRIQQKFDKFGWVCVSEDFNVHRITRELVECITRNNCAFVNLSALQNEISEAVSGKKVLLVLDDVWNENASLWEKFRAPLRSATLLKILVTTRNDPVAQIMQTVPTFKLDDLSEERCWELFQHYAFGQVNHNEGLKMIEVGKQIMKKCGRLPLAVKSIASLLRFEMEEESWREILESELWETDASNEIFPPLQISYTRLPTYLKPCFLYCSIFPKDHSIDLDELIKLWTYQGYIKLNGKNNPEKIGREYAKQLWQRSFLEGKWSENEFHLAYSCKLHDIVHDLARFNSDNGCYSIEMGKVPDFPEELYHLYVGNSVKLLEPLPSVKVTALRTLIIRSNPGILFCPFDFQKGHKLRALELSGPSLVCDLEFFSSCDSFKHLRYLFLNKFSFQNLPACICSLYNMQTFNLLDCECLQGLPESIGNLISLEELTIEGSSDIRMLPESFCQLQALRKLVLTECFNLEELPTDIGELTNLRTLSITDCDTISCLPPSLNKLTETLKIEANLCCKTMSWLKDLVGLGGNLFLRCLDSVPSLTDVQCSPFVNMHNLECLELCWGGEYINDSRNGLDITIECDQNIFLDAQNDSALMYRLQPHPNLRSLYITTYRGVTFPEWIRNPISCPSLTTLAISNCANIVFLPFGSLCSLNYLEILCCSSLPFIGAESLPLELKKLSIKNCKKLKSVSGIGKLKSLDEISISGCKDLQLVKDAEPSQAELTMPTSKSTYQNSLLGLRNLTSLRSLWISYCSKLCMFTDELPPPGSCKVEVSNCPGLKEWCLQHNITYEVLRLNKIDVDDDDDDDR